jgi:uncharacterized phage protein (TIGR02218 family)
VRDVRAVSLSLLENRTHYHAKLWLIERVDGVRKFLTNHDREIEFDSTRPFVVLGASDLQTYKPSGSFSASASQRASGLRVSNKSLEGTITSDEITEADLHTGLYRDAKITEYTVDYRFPMLGPITTDVYWVESIEKGENIHTVNVEGLARFLQRATGNSVTKLCPAALGDDECKKDLTKMQRLAVAVEAVTDRQTFTATAATLPTDTAAPDPDLEDDYFALGELVWVTGDNTGVVSKVARFTLSTRAFVLRFPTPNDITAGDTYNVKPGCNKSLGFCHSQFDNKDNFQGDHLVPGAQRVNKGPEFED